MIDVEAVPPRLFFAKALTVCVVLSQVVLCCELSVCESVVPVPRYWSIESTQVTVTVLAPDPAEADALKVIGEDVDAPKVMTYSELLVGDVILTVGVGGLGFGVAVGIAVAVGTAVAVGATVGTVGTSTVGFAPSPVCPVEVPPLLQLVSIVAVTAPP